MEFYRRRLPHFKVDHHSHFVTFATCQRRALPTWARKIVLDACLFNHGRRYELLVVVVMPDHAHMIFTPNADTQLRLITRSIKSFSAHEINRISGQHGPVWQEESFDHVIRSWESLQEKVAYIRENPVRRGLVEQAEDYRWCWVANG